MKIKVWPLFIAIMLAAAFMRFFVLETVPPGMPIDEAVNVGVVHAIAAGWRPIFIPQGWGREPLFHYIATLLFTFAGHAQFALRLTAAFIGLALVPATGVFTSRILNRRAGLLAMAFMSITYWAVFTSRYGVRGILLPLLSTFTVLAFWRALDSSSQTRTTKFAWAGVLLGLTFYTYQASRVFPLVFVAIGMWLWCFDRGRFRTAWRGMLLFFVIGLIVGAPLFAYLLTHPDAESSRTFMLEPIENLRKGDFGPIAGTVLAALGAFSFDVGSWYTNVPGHGIFPSVTGTLFYLGLIACLLRWRDVRRFTLLAWLGIGLAPAMLTSGLHYFRLSGIMTPGLALPAIGLVEMSDWLARRFGRDRAARESAVTLVLIGALALGQSALTTWRDYFQTWAISADVRDLHDANLREIGRYLGRSADTTPVVIASVAAEDVEPALFDPMLERTDLDQRWFDASTAIVFPGGMPTARYIFRPETPLRAALADYFAGAQPLTEQHWNDGPLTFKVYQLDLGRARDAAEARAAWPLGKINATPVRWGDKVDLLGYTVPLTITPGNPLRLLTTWRVVHTALPGPSGIFAHLLDANGHIVTQDDHLGFPRHSWHVGDVFVQFSRLDIAPETAVGRYTLQIGFYDKDTQARWPVTDAVGKTLGDHLVLGQLVVSGR